MYPFSVVYKVKNVNISMSEMTKIEAIEQLRKSNLITEIQEEEFKKHFI